MHCTTILCFNIPSFGQQHKQQCSDSKRGERSECQRYGAEHSLRVSVAGRCCYLTSFRLEGHWSTETLCLETKKETSYIYHINTIIGPIVRQVLLFFEESTQ